MIGDRSTETNDRVSGRTVLRLCSYPRIWTRETAGTHVCILLSGQCPRMLCVESMDHLAPKISDHIPPPPPLQEYKADERKARTNKLRERESRCVCMRERERERERECHIVSMSQSGLRRDRIDRRGAGATGLEAGSVGDGAFPEGELEAGVAGTCTLKPKRWRMKRRLRVKMRPLGRRTK